MAEINSQIRKYIDENDVEAVKSTLTGLAYVGDAESFSEFKASAEFAQKHINDLFEPDDNEEYSEEITLAGYKKVARLMMNNFSEKKYKTVIRIGLEVFKKNEQHSEKLQKDEVDENPLSGALKSPAKIVIAALMILAVIFLIAKLI